MTHSGRTDTDLVVVGAGLAGLVATAELVEAGKRVVLVDQEGEQGIGGQAYWSFGGLFLIGTPEQRRLGINDSVELAWQDWQGSAQFDRPEDRWPRAWAEAYVNFAAGSRRGWSRPEGSVATTTWCGRAGPRGWAHHRSR